jgi:hypothetical protein
MDVTGEAKPCKEREINEKGIKDASPQFLFMSSFRIQNHFARGFSFSIQA